MNLKSTSVQFKTSENRTPTNPDKICEEIFPSYHSVYLVHEVFLRSQGRRELKITTERREGERGRGERGGEGEASEEEASEASGRGQRRKTSGTQGTNCREVCFGILS